MPVYQYKALDAEGKPARGVIDADTPRAARDKLRAQALHVTDMGPAEAGSAGAQPGAAPPGQGLAELISSFGGGVDLLELAMLTRQLATLLAAGITVTDGLSAMIEQLEGAPLERTFRGVRERITQGGTLADALAAYPRVFSELYVNMVRAGEASGSLEVVLRRLADYIQEQARLRGRLSAALAYPLVMCAIGAGVVGFLMAYVVPKITRVLVQQGKVLPLPTRMLITLSDLVVATWPMLIAGAVACVLGYLSLVRTEQGALAVDRLKLRLPIVGELLRRHAISRFAKTFSTLLASGLQVTESLRITRKVVDNLVVAKTLDDVHDRIMEGADIATPLRASGVFPPAVSYMIAVGEQSGQLEELLTRIADSYDEEIELTTQKMLSLLEPLLIVGMSTIVGFIVISIVLPILKASQF